MSFVTFLKNLIPPLNILGFVSGDDYRAAKLATEMIAHAPKDCKVVVAFDQQKWFSDEWVSRTWPDKDVRVVSWKVYGTLLTS